MPHEYRCARKALTPALFLLIGATACGGTPPPPPRAVNAPSPGGDAEPAAGASTAALGDSALEPAAARAAKDEDWPRAESLYRELARRQPRNAAAKRGLGVALERQGQAADKPELLNRAVAAFEDSLAIADNAGTRIDLATAFIALGRQPSALPHLRKAVQLAPAEPAGWTLLAETLIKLDKPDGAADALHESMKVCASCAANETWNRADDEAARALQSRATHQLTSGDATGAQKSADVAAALRPNLPETHLTLGQVARARGNAKAAATEYRKAVDGLPDAKADTGASARLELASLLLTDGGGVEAAQLASQVIAARGDDAAALDTLGRACDAKRDAGCARKAYGKLAKLPPEGAAAKEAVEHAHRRMKELKSHRR